MQKKAHTPGESEEYPEYEPVYPEEEEEVVMDTESYPLQDDMIYDDRERDLLNGEGTNREDIIMETGSTQGSELDQELNRLKEKKLEREQEKERKQEIKEKKSEIRHLKYEPVYDAGAKLKEGMGIAGSKLGGFIAKKRGTPAEREARRAKMNMKMKRLADVAKTKAVSFGKSMHEKKSSNPFGGGGGFGNRKFLSQNMGDSSFFSGQDNTPNILRMEKTKLSGKESGSKIIGKNTLSFFDNKMGMMQGSKKTGMDMGSGFGSKLMQKNNILGSKKRKTGKKKGGLRLMNERIRL